MSFAEQLLKLRTEKGLSQQKLAEKAGISQAAIFQWEKGNRKPKIEQLQKIASALNVPIRDFLVEMDETERIRAELSIFQSNNEKFENLLKEILYLHNYRIQKESNHYLIISNYRDVNYRVKLSDYIDMLSRCDKDIKYNIDKLLDSSERL